LTPRGNRKEEEKQRRKILNLFLVNEPEKEMLHLKSNKRGSVLSTKNIPCKCKLLKINGHQTQLRELTKDMREI